jgi:hypothetical protein
MGRKAEVSTFGVQVVAGPLWIDPLSVFET